jgi:hypothetical protein
MQPSFLVSRWTKSPAAACSWRCPMGGGSIRRRRDISTRRSSRAIVAALIPTAAAVSAHVHRCWRTFRLPDPGEWQPLLPQVGLGEHPLASSHLAIAVLLRRMRDMASPLQVRLNGAPDGTTVLKLTGYVGFCPVTARTP